MAVRSYIFCFLLLISATDLSAAVIEASADAHPGGASQANLNNGMAQQLAVRSNPIQLGLSNKAYIRFDLSALDVDVVTDALFTLVAAESYTTLSPSPTVINVYGLNDGDAGELWGETTIKWTNAPANIQNSSNGIVLSQASLLGDFSIISDTLIGDEIHFSSAALDDFLNADTNDSVTLILAAESDNGINSDGARFASKDHSSLTGPTLTIEDAVTVSQVPIPGRLSYALGGMIFGLVWRQRR